MEMNWNNFIWFMKLAGQSPPCFTGWFELKTKEVTCEH